MPNPISSGHSRRLGHLVGDLLELSRIESGKTELEHVPVDVGALIESLVQEQRPQVSPQATPTAVTTNLSGTQKPQADSSGKIGRNEACPCGSGKKYKRCHGAVA